MSLAATVGAVVIGAHLHTLHFGNDDGTPAAFRNRDDTPGLFVRVPEYPLLGGEPTAGVYRNSVGRTSVYGGLTWHNESRRFAASLALASGYQYERLYGQAACKAGRLSVEHNPCWWDHGKTHAKLMPIGALSVAFPETKPYLLGGTARVLWIGKGVSLAVEWGGR